MTFAAITPALIVGAFAERMKFSAVALFIPLWVTFVYFPIAHMVWYWAGPDAIDAAAKALAAAADGAAKTRPRRPSSTRSLADAGLIFSWGAIDFAGGTVVHINAGIAGLVGALLVGKRIGFGKELMPPHSLVMTLIGACLLWVGWFGFNAGSNLEATGGAALAMINTFVATAAAALSWMFAEWAVKGKPSLLGALSGAIAGLVAVTPAAGFAGPMGAIVLGLIAGVVCLFFCSTVKNMFGYDDALDVFGIHCIGGIVGAIGTGILVAPALGGTGIMDYATGKIADYDFVTQVIAQCKAVLMTLVWSGVGSLIIYKVVDYTVGLRADRRAASAKASTSPTTASAPTTCKRRSDTVGADTRHRPVRREASVARPGPLSFSGRLDRASGRSPMVNHALTSPPPMVSKAHAAGGSAARSTVEFHDRRHRRVTARPPRPKAARRSCGCTSCWPTSSRASPRSICRSASRSMPIPPFVGPVLAGASQRFRPLSGQQGHRAASAGRRRLARPALQAAAPARPGEPRSSCSTAPARACSSARSRPSASSPQRAGKPAILIPNPFYAAYSAGAAAADCEPVYLPATRETGFLPDLDAIGEELLARTVAFYLASPSNPQGAVADVAYLDAARRRWRGASASWCSPTNATARSISTAGRRTACWRRRRPTSPTSWCSTRCRSAPTCPACASASPPATAASSPATSSCATSRRRRCRCRRRRSRSPPTATRRTSTRTASSTSRSSISPTRSSATATATSARPAASSSGSTSARRAATRRRRMKLWREGGLRVIPGHYLARDGADGRNPGTGYIRVALVQDKETTAEALHRLVAVLGLTTMAAIDRSIDVSLLVRRPARRDPPPRFAKAAASR